MRSLGRLREKSSSPGHRLEFRFVLVAVRLQYQVPNPLQTWTFAGSTLIR
jgi:hypothetical protein